MVFRGNRAGTFIIYIDNLRVRHADGSTTSIWQDGADSRFRQPLDLPPGFTDLRVRAVELADLNTTIDDGSTDARWAGSVVGGVGVVVLVVLLAVGGLQALRSFRLRSRV